MELNEDEKKALIERIEAVSLVLQHAEVHLTRYFLAVGGNENRALVLAHAAEYGFRSIVEALEYNASDSDTEKEAKATARKNRVEERLVKAKSLAEDTYSTNIFDSDQVAKGLFKEASEQVESGLRGEIDRFLNAGTTIANISTMWEQKAQALLERGELTQLMCFNRRID